MNDFDAKIRLFVYQTALRSGEVPSPLETAAHFATTILEVEASFHRLATEHSALVLLPGSRYVWMAEPFSALPTDFPVLQGARRWYGNCVWDALAVAALLGGDADVPTACPVSGAPLLLSVRDGKLVAAPGIVHFAVKPRDWWQSIGFT